MHTLGLMLDMKREGNIHSRISRLGLMLDIKREGIHGCCRLAGRNHPNSLTDSLSIIQILAIGKDDISCSPCTYPATRIHYAANPG